MTGTHGEHAGSSLTRRQLRDLERQNTGQLDSTRQESSGLPLENQVAGQPLTRRQLARLEENRPEPPAAEGSAAGSRRERRSEYSTASTASAAIPAAMPLEAVSHADATLREVEVFQQEGARQGSYQKYAGGYDSRRSATGGRHARAPELASEHTAPAAPPSSLSSLLSVSRKLASETSTASAPHRPAPASGSYGWENAPPAEPSAPPTMPTQYRPPPTQRPDPEDERPFWAQVPKASGHTPGTAPESSSRSISKAVVSSASIAHSPAPGTYGGGPTGSIFSNTKNYGTAATSTLIMSTAGRPTEMITETGDVMLTSTVDLPRSLGETGSFGHLIEATDLEEPAPEQQHIVTSMVPVSASNAVSSVVQSSAQLFVEGRKSRFKTLGVPLIIALPVLLGVGLVIMFVMSQNMR